MSRRYIKRRFSYDLGPGIPAFRPSGWYKKQRKVGMEFYFDNINSYASEVDVDKIMCHIKFMDIILTDIGTMMPLEVV